MSAQALVLRSQSVMTSQADRALRWSIFLGAALGVLYLCLSMLRPFAGVVAWSVVLAIICDPLHQLLVRRTGRAALSAFITSVLTVFAFLVPLVLIGAVAVTQGVALGHALRDALQSPDQSVAGISTALAALANRVGVGQDTIAAWVEHSRADWVRSAGQHTMSIAANLIEAFASLLFVVIALFLLLRDGTRIVSVVSDLMPFEQPRSELLLRRIKTVVQASVYGVVVIALMHGAVYGTAFWLLRVPSAALWGMVTVFASVVPVVGALSVWGPVAVYLAVNRHWVEVALLAVTAAGVSGVDHVLRPRLVAGRVGLGELAMFFALLGGVTVFGALGVVLGPVAFATVAAIVDTLREHSPTAPPVRAEHERAA